MTWLYAQRSGTMRHDSGVIATGYSGHGEGLNNPAMEAVEGVGPIPAGPWRIGTAFDHPHLGPCVMHLTPVPAFDAHGRSAFFIHGDNAAGDFSASHGCIILPRAAREAIAASGDRDLTVTP